MKISSKRISLGITGASGAIYAVSLLRELVAHYDEVHLMITDAARVVLATELDIKLPESPSKIQEKLAQELRCESQKMLVHAKHNWYAPVASGSAAPRQMVICPASMGCISAIATGASNTLLERAADVVLKERGQLIVLPREMPFSTVHLRNLLSLSEQGVTVMPAAPGYYGQPETIQDLADFVTSRVLNHLGIENQLGETWGYSK